MINVRHTHAALPSMPSGPYELNPCKGFFSIVTAAGQVITLNSLGVKVLSYIGGGMPPVENITTPLGILGGSVLQRTVARPRTITLACAVYGRDLLRVQRIKQSLINLVAPSVSLQTPANIKLRYQLVDGRGNLLGNILEVAVIYQGDLAGQTDNLNEERFALQFLELAPPGIVEIGSNTSNLTMPVQVNSYTGFHVRAANGTWSHTAIGSPNWITTLAYSPSGELWYGTTAKVSNLSGTISVAVNGSVKEIVFGPDGYPIAGGNFNSPFNYIMRYNGAAWVAVGAGGFNSSVERMTFDNSGNLYAFGTFSIPGPQIAKYDGTSWSALGGGITAYNAAGQLLKGFDGKIYIFGRFTAFNGQPTNGIAVYDPANGSMAGVLGGMGSSASTAFSAVNLPNGEILVSGDFTSIGGVAAVRLAIYNGNSFRAALSNTLDGYAHRMAVNYNTGDTYLFGTFGNTYFNPAITSNFAKYVNGAMYPQDFTYLVSSGVIKSGAIRQSDGEVALGEGGGVNYMPAGITTINYAGTADVNPQVKITGPGRIYMLKNYTTGKTIYFDYLLLAGEILLLQTGNTVTFKSNFADDVINKILSGSDTTAFALAPGSNNIGVMFDNNFTGATKVELIYKNTHWSFEAGV